MLRSDLTRKLAMEARCARRFIDGPRQPFGDELAYLVSPSGEWCREPAGARAWKRLVAAKVLDRPFLECTPIAELRDAELGRLFLTHVAELVLWYHHTADGEGVRCAGDSFRFTDAGVDVDAAVAPTLHRALNAHCSVRVAAAEIAHSVLLILGEIRRRGVLEETIVDMLVVCACLPVLRAATRPLTQ